MAKLTARFDIKDNITKKIRSIHGEIEKLERSRERMNRPVTMMMRVRDNATKILRRIQILVLKDIAKTHTVAVKVKDGATKTLTSISNFMKRRMPRTHALFVSARDRATPVLQRISRFAQRNIGRTQLMTILATDRAMPVIRRVGSFARSTLSKGYNFTVRGIDMASRVIGRVASYTATAIPRVRTFTIRAVNMASNVIGSVKSALFSMPTVITVTLAAVGIGQLKQATVGAAMNFEDYGVAMNHWLKGDKKASADLMTWMGQKADKTPYSSPDIFPAMVGAVSLAGNDQAGIKRLTSAAIDMAALSGGTRTVDDAMQAIIGANMGNLEMMKGFGLNITKKEYDKMGFEGFVSHVESVFEGGAEALSKTARGITSTLKGYRSSLMRTFGDGLLGPMKPRLDAINKWLDENQETWGRWKKVVERHGEEASEFIFSKLEISFNHLRSRYLDNKDFMDLNFEGKIKFVSEDIGSWWSSKGKPALDGWWESSGKPWAEKVGLFMGESIFNGIVKGGKEGGKALGGMWGDALKKPSIESLGGAGIATLLAVSIASLVLSPLITAVSLMAKGVKGAVGAGKKIKGFFNKGPTNTPVVTGTGKRVKVAKPVKPVYTMPWTNKGSKAPKNPTPNAKPIKFPKLDKGLSGLGKFTKGIPILGAALGALSIITAKKEDKAGAVGAVGGGLVGAATGAAVGSVVPVIGTAIGGLVGGIIGAIGGQAIGDWLSGNWSSIKEGASNTGKWISEKFKESTNWVKGAWSASTAWFSETIWAPLKEGFNKALNFIVGLYDIAEQGILLAWGFVTNWFSENVWTPLTTAAGFALGWVGEKFDLAWLAVTTIWGLAWTWFEETVWAPIKTGVELVGLWIGEKFNLGWTAITEIWGIAAGWFEETIWSPLTTAAGILGAWIGEKFTEGWGVVTDVWGVASGYFEDNIWSPIKTGATAVKDWIVGAFGDAWDYVSGIFTKLGETWDTIKQWGGKAVEWGGTAVDYVIKRGDERRGKDPKYAQGTNFHPGGPAIVGDGGGPELIRYPNGGMSLSPGTDTRVNLPRGTEVLSHRKTVKYFNQVPAYADGVGFSGGIPEKVVLPEEQVAAASLPSKGGGGKSTGGAIRDINIEITGDNHYSNDMDAERVGKIAYDYIKKALQNERFEGGEMVVDG